MDRKGNILIKDSGNIRGIRNYLALILTLIKIKSNSSFKFLSYIGLTQNPYFIIYEFNISHILTLFIDRNLTPTSSAPTKVLRQNMFSVKYERESLSIIAAVEVIRDSEGLRKSVADEKSFMANRPLVMEKNHMNFMVNTLVKYGIVLNKSV
ncbi:hypothetical protein ACTFIW_001005 [Dictyostelium discoideum]